VLYVLSVLVRVAGDSAEYTTNSTSITTLKDFTGLNIEQGTRVRITGKFRKSSGATANGRIGLRINSSDVFTAGVNNMISIDNTDANFDGVFWVEFYPGETSYRVGIQGQSSFGQTALGSGRQTTDIGVNNMTVLMPVSDITSIAIRGLVTNSGATLAVKDLQIYTYANE